MKALKPYKFGASASDQVTDTRETADWLRLKGSPNKPLAPRDVRALPSSRGVQLFWSLPIEHGNIKGWRIFKDNENTPIADIADKGIRQKFIELSSGTTPPPTSLFVCAVNAQGGESAKVQVITSAIVEAGAPQIPTPPAEYSKQISGGGDRRTGTNSRGFNTL